MRLGLVEAISCAAALLGVAALSHGRRPGWLLASLGSLGYVYWNWKLNLPGQATLNLVYLVTQLWGWLHWGKQPTFRSSPTAHRWLLTIFPLALTLQIFWNAADAWLTAAGLVVQSLTAGGIQQVWRYWVVIDLASAALYGYHQAWLTAGLYLIFAGIAESAHRHWVNQAKSPAGPDR